MNHNHTAFHELVKGMMELGKEMKPLKSQKNPIIAAACGFAFGGVGLGIYLESWMDTVIPFAILLLLFVLGVPTGEFLVLIAPFLWATYGYRRAVASNSKLVGLS